MTGYRVLHVSANRYPPLPAEHNTLPIWRELARGADEYHVLARSHTCESSHTRVGNIHLHLLPSLVARQAEFFVTSWVLIAHVRRVRPTHLIAQCPVLGGLAVAACAAMFRLPTLIELHGEHYFNRGVKAGVAGAFFRALTRISLKRATKVRALSLDMKQQIEATFGREIGQRTVVVPTRVDLQTFSPAKQDYAVPGPLRLITVGGFAPVKNHLALIRAMRGAGTPATLTLVGGGPMEAAYKAEIARLGLGDRITLLPWLPQAQLAKLMFEHDAYVHYSSSEGLSRAVLEAMAMGLPVVATRVGFIAGVLEDDDNALLLYEPWDAQFSAAVRRLYESESLRRRIGTRAHQTISERFEWNAVFDQYRAELFGIGLMHVRGESRA